MIAIWNGGGRLGGRDPNHNTAKGDFSYTVAGDKCPVMQRVLEEKIFPWMDPRQSYNFKNCNLIQD